MNEMTFHLAVLILPLLVSNVLHMFVVRYNYLPALSLPLSSKTFGSNKTIRGFILLPLMNAILLFFTDALLNLELRYAFATGALLGLAYMASELPNSYFKRRLGIAPGSSHHRYGKLFKLLDKMDSAFGVALTYCLLGFADPLLALFLFLIGSFTHIFFSQVLYMLKIKKSF